MRVRPGRGWAVAGALVLLAACGGGPVADAHPADGGDRPATAHPSVTTTAPVQAGTVASPPVTTPPTVTPLVATPPADGSGERSEASPDGPAAAESEPASAGDQDGEAAGDPAGVTSSAILPSAAPLSLVVPAIGIDSPLVRLGRNPDGTVEVPSLDDPDAKPGWYDGSPTPGSLGPAIILGHVDSRRYGPGVFYRLADLRPGDQVDVARANGTVARFAVDAVQEVAKRDFPTLAVYGNLDHPGLRLITCGGRFDPDAGSYESNIIVFASLVGAG